MNILKYINNYLQEGKLFTFVSLILYIIKCIFNNIGKL
nr:MAG TPA: hypothetical protein [Caudoviricetes sp.]